MSRKSSLRQLTIRGFEPEVEAYIRELARREQLSLNQAVMKLLRRGAGVAEAEDPEVDRIGTSLDHLAGTWSSKDEREFARTVASLERVDPEFWGETRKPLRRRE